MTSHGEFVERNLGRNYRKQISAKGKSYTDIPVFLHVAKSESETLLTEAQLKGVPILSIENSRVTSDGAFRVTSDGANRVFT